MTILETDRLVLRQFELSDNLSMLRVFGDARVMQYGDGVQTQEWVSEWIHSCLKSYQKRGFGPWAVVKNVTRNVVGYCGLIYYSDVNGNSEIEIGYRLARVFWGQGYATEAALAVRDYGFSALGFRRLVSIIDPENTVSIRVAEKLDMKYEGDVIFDGYTHPDRVYVINARSV